MSKFKLCYVDDCWAYFTTQDLDKQWGDDWNDAPYEHNAGEPYEYGDHDKAAGKDPWEIQKIAFDAPLETPGDIANGNSSYSVEDVNAGAVAWLGSNCWSKEKVYIHAGVSIDGFCGLVFRAGGKVYLEAPVNADA